MYCTSRKRVFETNEEGNAIAAFGWGGEELDLIATCGHVELAGDAKGLDVGKSVVCQLVDDDLYANHINISNPDVQSTS